MYSGGQSGDLQRSCHAKWATPGSDRRFTRSVAAFLAICISA